MTYIALLRGINVGGKNTLPMKDLRAMLKSLGLENIRTYIQSGNVVFRAQDKNASATEIAKAILESYGFEPELILLGASEFEKATAANPFPEAVTEPRTLHLWFLKSVPQNVDFDLLHRLAKESERFELKNKVFYLHAPEGIGRSKLAEKVEKALGVSATARNWRTVSKLQEMLLSG